MSTPRLTRAATGLPPAAAGTLLVPSEVAGLAVHWNGPAVPLPASRGELDGVRRYLLAIYRQHVGVNGWSDVAYQWAVDQAGRRWELRGWRRRSAANGDTDPNRRYGAVLAIIGQGQHPTPQLLAGLADARADFRRVYPQATLLRTHNQVRPEPTECPGADLTRWVAAGGPEPKGTEMDLTDKIAIPEAIAKELGARSTYTVAELLRGAWVEAARGHRDAKAAKALAEAAALAGRPLTADETAAIVRDAVEAGLDDAVVNVDVNVGGRPVDPPPA